MVFGAAEDGDVFCRYVPTDEYRDVHGAQLMVYKFALEYTKGEEPHS
jgi:hypothetical protein